MFTISICSLYEYSLYRESTVFTYFVCYTVVHNGIRIALFPGILPPPGLFRCLPAMSSFASAWPAVWVLRWAKAGLNLAPATSELPPRHMLFAAAVSASMAELRALQLEPMEWTMLETVVVASSTTNPTEGDFY